MGDDLIARTTINFERPLNPRNIENLFKFLAEKINSEVRYVETQQVRIGGASGENPWEFERYVQHLSGSIGSLESIGYFSIILSNNCLDSAKAPFSFSIDS